MPWKETRVMDERMRFIGAVIEDPRGNFTRLCARFGISRAKGYKWLARYRELGPAGLEDRKPVALTCPHRTPDEVVDRVVALRKQFPFDGPKKLRARLRVIEGPKFAVPAASTIGEILDRYGLVRPRRVRLRVPASSEPLGHAELPNDVWCTDFKGHFPCGDGVRCNPLTITDAVSRYLIKCEGLLRATEALTRMQFELAFREFGVPRRIRSDNGVPFATTAVGGLSMLSVWWVQLGIVPERIEPGQPQQNGRHERMHRTLKEQTANPPSASMNDQQRAFDRFRADYNDRRPHEALGQTPPASHYEPSLRLMPERLRSPEYGDDFKVRRSCENGTLIFRGNLFRFGKVIASQPLGFLPVDEDEWELHFGPMLLAHVLIRNGEARLVSP
jgi:transposase InsO family protein